MEELFKVRSIVTNIVYSVYDVKKSFGIEKYLIYNNHGFYSDFEWWDVDRFIKIESQNQKENILDSDKFVKVVYRSEPIGDSGIILELTTFDLDAYRKYEELLEIPKKTTRIEVKPTIVEKENPCLLEDRLNALVENYYKVEIMRLQQELQCAKIKSNIAKKNKNAKNITNSGDVHCNTVYGNINNCDNIYCHEIKGSVVNCDKIIYK